MTSQIATNDVQAAIEGIARRRAGRADRIVRLMRRPSPYRTSFALEEVDVDFIDGSVERLIFKNLSRRALAAAAAAAKPLFVFDPRREIVAYETVLTSVSVGTARFYGAVADPPKDQYWLFIERVHGRELYQIGRFDTWMQAARWLARFHSAFAGRIDALPPSFLSCAIRYDTDFLRRWPQRALAHTKYDMHAAPHMVVELEKLAHHYEPVVDHLVSLPPTVLHGEYFASNILVRDDANDPGICPIDWEMAAIGPGLIDLAALIAGGWTEEEKERLAQAYYQSLDHGVYSGHDWDVFRTSLLHCRLHVAMQWLGWSEKWSPPPEHRFDWLGEALYLARRLGL